MHTKDLNDKEQVKFRIGRAGSNDVTWETWREGGLYIVRRGAALKKKSQFQAKSWAAGSILILTTVDVDTAEYSEDDYQGDGIFNCEDYYLEIANLE